MLIDKDVYQMDPGSLRLEVHEHNGVNDYWLISGIAALPLSEELLLEARELLNNYVDQCLGGTGAHG